MFKSPWNSQGQSDLLGEGEKCVDSMSKPKKTKRRQRKLVLQKQKGGRTGIEHFTVKSKI